MPLWSMDEWQYVEREVVTDPKGRQWTVALMDVLGQEGDPDMPNKLLELQYSSGRYFTLIYADGGALQRERGYASLSEATNAYEVCWWRHRRQPRSIATGVPAGPGRLSWMAPGIDIRLSLPAGIQISHHDMKHLPSQSGIALGNRRLQDALAAGIGGIAIGPRDCGSRAHPPRISPALSATVSRVSNDQSAIFSAGAPDAASAPSPLCSRASVTMASRIPQEVSSARS
jgi:hypothetical protein